MSQAENDRFALVTGYPNGNVDEIEALLYENYHVIADLGHVGWLIEGGDDAGFTLEAIRMRLSTGMYAAREVTVEEAAELMAS